MKVGIIGSGAVGAATVGALLRTSGLDAEVVVVNRNHDRAVGLAEDMILAGIALSATPTVTAGGYSDLQGASLVIITAGVNEKDGGATDRNDPRGRRVLIPANSRLYADLIPRISAAAPGATLLVVTDPPDPLADLARALAPNQPVVSTGTVIDSLRFRYQIARALRVPTSDVQANVIGEHGTSSVYLWSTATVGGARVVDLLARRGEEVEEQKNRIQKAVTFGNISIIEGIGASQYGIGAVVARLTNAILRDEHAVYPVASYLDEYGTTVAIPSILGARGVVETVLPTLTEAEAEGLAASAEVLREASQLALTSAGLN